MLLRRCGLVGLQHHIAHRGRGHDHDGRDDLRHDRAPNLVGDPAAQGSDGSTHKGPDPRVRQCRRRVGVFLCVLQHTGSVGRVLVAKNHRNGQGQGHGKADEAAKGHDIQGGHAPGVFVAENGKLLLYVLLHRTKGGQAHHQQGRGDVQGNGHPHVQQAQARRRRQIQVEHANRRDKGQRVQVGDLGEGHHRATGGGRYRLEVAHAPPAQQGQGNQRQHPSKAGVLNPGRRPCGNLAQNPAAVFDQHFGLTAEGTEQAHGHDQRDHNLHGGHAKISQPGVEPQGGALQALGEEGADVRHRRGKVTSAHTRPQSHELEHPQWPLRVLQRNASPDGRGQQHGSGQKDGVAAPRHADQERSRDAHGRARNAGNGSQGEQLGLGEREAQVEHLHRDDAPHPPDREAAQQGRDRYPEIAISDFLARALPELCIFRAPIGNVGVGVALQGHVVGPSSGGKNWWRSDP